MSNILNIDATKLTSKQLSLLLLQEQRSTNEKLNSIEKNIREESNKRFKLLEDRVEKLETQNEKLKPLQTKLILLLSLGGILFGAVIHFITQYFIKLL